MMSGATLDSGSSCIPWYSEEILDQQRLLECHHSEESFDQDIVLEPQYCGSSWGEQIVFGVDSSYVLPCMVE